MNLAVTETVGEANENVSLLERLALLLSLVGELTLKLTLMWKLRQTLAC